MLNKLMKHELRSTSRIMLPILAAVLGLSVMSGISFRIMGSGLELHWTIKVMFFLMEAAFFLSLFAACVVAFVLMIQRFYKSLLGDEGYITMTLPVSVDGHLWNKLFTSVLWFVAVLAACVVGILLCSALSKGFYNGAGIKLSVQNFFSGAGTGKLILACFQFLLLLILVGFTACLRFYCSMAIGFSASGSKKLLSVVAYFAIGIVRNLFALIPGGVLLGMGARGMFSALFTGLDALSAESISNLAFTGVFFAVAVLGTAYYFVTRFFLTKKLNLA